MEKELIEFINENEIEPFASSNSGLRFNSGSMFKTADAKIIFSRMIEKLSEGFAFPHTEKLWYAFPFIQENDEIRRRQLFFSSIANGVQNEFLKLLRQPKKNWKPNYGIVVATEDEKTFAKLKDIGCPVQIIISEYDLGVFENYDVVQVIDCENYAIALERLPQAVFLDSVEQAYLERYLEQLSGWKDNLAVLQSNKTNSKIEGIVSELSKLVFLLEKENREKLTREKAVEILEKMNYTLFNDVKKMTISGEILFDMFSNNSLPKELKSKIAEIIKGSGLPENIFDAGMPIKLDEKELDAIIKKESAKEFGNAAERVKKYSSELRKIPDLLKELNAELMLYDFMSGVSKLKKENYSPAEISEDLLIENSLNLLIDNPKPISFILNDRERCSILTGANSGGKTTLLEHIIQIICLQQIGLPVSGKVRMPLFSEVFYFAKNKGSFSKGAFETLLTQMAQIKAGKKTLILADEIESVTEPGVAGKIVAASADYFIKKGAFLIIATHLGHEIKKVLPANARIDGIEAKGLDENFELIVEHNPVLGRLANSTPELIVEKLANSKSEDYYKYLNEYLKNS